MLVDPGRDTMHGVRRAFLFGVLWVAATAVTASVAWGAVRLAGEQAGEEAVRPLSVRQVEALAGSTTAAVATSTSSLPTTAASSSTTWANGTVPEATSSTSTSAPVAMARPTRGGTVVVSSPQVPKPVAVRFGWHQTAEPNLMNKAGLPASPFRTGQW